MSEIVKCMGWCLSSEVFLGNLWMETDTVQGYTAEITIGYDENLLYTIWWLVVRMVG